MTKVFQKEDSTVHVMDESTRLILKYGDEKQGEVFSLKYWSDLSKLKVNWDKHQVDRELSGTEEAMFERAVSSARRAASPLLRTISPESVRIFENPETNELRLLLTEPRIVCKFFVDEQGVRSKKFFSCKHWKGGVDAVVTDWNTKEVRRRLSADELSLMSLALRAFFEAVQKFNTSRL